jgi:hypothetical protein
MDYLTKKSSKIDGYERRGAIGTFFKLPGLPCGVSKMLPPTR